jgi:plasmid stabilization system protein ParE
LNVTPVVFLPAARWEMFDARDWYNERDAGLGDRFIDEIERAASRIASAPRQFPIIFEDIRRARCKRFPYALFFRMVEETAYVMACFHSSRNPREWQNRA